MEKARIRVDVGENGQVNWARGGNGLSVKDFVTKHPCNALEHLAGGATDDLSEAIISAIGGKGNLIQFNKDKNCGCDDGVLQQV